CGHDGHTAIGLGVAKLLSAQREHLAGRVKFVFQPAEEIARGAQAMIDDGALANPSPDVCMGLHLWNTLPVGEVGIVDGPTMAGCDIFGITIRGVGGHGGIPDKATDPLVAGAQIVMALQTIVSRNVSPLDTAVVSVTMFHAGETDNVISPVAELRGTFRTFRPQTRDLVERRLREIATGIAASMGCQAEVEVVSLTPPLSNDAATNARLRQAFSHLTNGTGPHPVHLRADSQTMAAEDMAVFLQKIPGTFLLVGSSNAARELNYPHHHPRFDFDEDVLPLATGLLATAVADYVLRE
ncbi:MAG TPA: amidohydrolase, partial [Aggregatilineales bacterium]|nr:amidohydrolase [Aggregatilineales bacterium]